MTSTRTPLLAVAISANLLLLAARASGQDGEELPWSPTVGGAFKATSLLSYSPDDPLLFPERRTARALGRARLTLDVHPSDWIDGQVSYEHRAMVVSKGGSGLAGAGLLPAAGEAPYRIAQGDWEIAEDEPRFQYRHEFDRALFAFHPDWGEVVLGRQAIGLGRGALFGAVDFFAPFSPLEIDREWRRGVDAARTEFRLSDTTSLELFAVFGRHRDQSAALARLRGYVGEIDAELIAGRRRHDNVLALVGSGVLGDSEIHGEIAAFHTPEEQPQPGLLGNDRLPVKAVLGASHTFDVGDGLTLLGEYHYSGFGIEDVADLHTRFPDPDFQERYRYGDSQIFGQHAAAFRLSLPFGMTGAGSVTTLFSPKDGSGVLMPGFVWDMAANLSLTTTAYFPWGDEPENGRLQSEYGATATSLFLQLTAYF